MKPLRNSFRFAFAGLRTLVRSERNFGIHVFALAAVLVLGLIFHLHTWEWVSITGMAALVLALEAVNTALEKLCDLVQPDFHPVIKQVKDMAAAGVLIAAIAAVVVAYLVFGPRVLELF
jgi:diacylglycerol kinase